MNHKLKNFLKYILFNDSLFKDSLVIIFFILLFLLIKNIKQNLNQPACLLTPAVINTAIVDGSAVNLSWLNGQESTAAFINISNFKSLESDGTFRKVDILNDSVTGKTSYSMGNLNPGTYYWNIISDGCQPTKRKVSTLGSFTIPNP